MAIPIYSDKNLASGYSHAGLKNQGSSSVVETHPIAETKNIDKNLKKPDSSIQISHEAKVLNDHIKSIPTDVIDVAKVNKIKAQLNSGSYAINNQQLATKMLDFENKIV